MRDNSTVSIVALAQQLGISSTAIATLYRRTNRTLGFAAYLFSYRWRKLGFCNGI